jgi:hypothetical protein
VIWRKEMPKEMAELTEFICDPEMRLFGYTPEVYDPSTGLSQGAFQYALDNINTCTGWNTDFVDPEQSLACEFFRKQALSSSVDLTESQIKRCFLFDDVYKACLGIL